MRFTLPSDGKELEVTNMLKLVWAERADAKEGLRFVRVTCRRGSLLPVHYHDFPETFWIESGRCAHFINGERQELESGAMVFIRARDRHRLAPAGRGGFTMINIEWHPQWYQSVLERFPEETKLLHGAAQPSMVQLAPFRVEELSSLVSEVALLRRTRFDMEWLLMQLVHIVVPRRMAGEMAGPAWLTEAIISLQESEIMSQGVPGLVAVAGRSREHVARVARQTLGKTPGELVTEARVAYASRHLRLSERSINEIALDCGFESPASLYRCFRRAHGMSPRQYRQKSRAIV